MVSDTHPPPAPEPCGPEQLAKIRGDLASIIALIAPQSRVLDVGCGDGTLLVHLAQMLRVDGRGIELEQHHVNTCVARGLSVIQGNADADLTHYPSDSFDTVILSQTVQATRQPRAVLRELLRIGRSVIVSLPNFGHWRVRMHLLMRGTMPVTKWLPDTWDATPNIHLCTIRDFGNLCTDLGADIEKLIAIGSRGRTINASWSTSMNNVFAEQAIFVLRGPRPEPHLEQDETAK